MKRKGKRMGDVHFVFSHHPKGQKYYPRSNPSNNTTLILNEAYKGTPAETIFSRLESKNRKSVRDVSKYEFQKKAVEKGIRIRTGEEPLSAREKKRFESILNKRLAAGEKYNGSPSFQNFVKFMDAFADLIKYRNELIRKKIHSKGKGRVEAVYGRTHSTLRWFLRNEGIESTSEMHQRVMPYHARILRAIEIGKKPSVLEYRNAMLSYALEQKMFEREAAQRLFGVSELADRHTRFIDVLSSTLIDKLSRSQIEEISTSLKLENLFELNGLEVPWEISPQKRNAYVAKLKNFLKKNSIFYRRTLAAGKRI